MADAPDLPPAAPAPGALPVLRAEAERLALPLPERAIDQFQRYLALLDAWNDQIGRAHV